MRIYSDKMFYCMPRKSNQEVRHTGLVAYLTRYSSPKILQNGAINGAIIENYVVSKIIKTYHNCGKDCFLWYYRDKNCNEIDIVIEADGKLNPL